MYTKKLAVLFDEISTLQNQYLAALGLQKELLSQSLAAKWEVLDSLCLDIYEATDEERKIIQEEGRTMSRVELLNGAGL